MTTKKRSGSGRATPKGTKNPEKKVKAKRTDIPDKGVSRQTELPGKGGATSNQRAARPVSHNRGNR